MASLKCRPGCSCKKHANGSYPCPDGCRCWRRIEFLDRKGRLWKMRSSWEVTTAKRMDELGLTWFYEPVALLLSDGRRYIPDFFLVEWGSYLEVKGWPDNIEKFDLAVRDGFKIFLIDEVPIAH